MFTPDAENEGFFYAEKIINETNHSLFLTGKAGTGKSTFLRHISDNTKKNHIVVAPTGIAAINARGQTIHSFFGIPFGPLQPQDARLRKHQYRDEKLEIIKSLELLIIDEISMVRADLLDAVDFLLRKTRKSPFPFGGVQVLLVGDLFQLEPVVQEQDKLFLENFYRSPFFFESWAVKEMVLVNIELEKIYRQQDPFFISLLNKIRSKTASYQDLIKLNQLPSKIPHDSQDFYITLATTRKNADKTNIQKLAQIHNLEYTFEGEIKDDFPAKNLPTDFSLKLKQGAQVIFIRNDVNEIRRWVNGTLGVIDEISKDKIVVRLQNGQVHELEETTWDNIKYKFNKEKNQIEEEVVGSFTQFPIKLAWAITIHKSQGLTFDRIVLDLGWGAFAAGQLYVALSRCRTIEGIVLKNKIKQSDVKVREEVIAYYEAMNDTTQIRNALKG